MQWLADLLLRLSAISPWDVLDIVLVAGLIYTLLYVVRGTRAVQLLRGVLLLAPAVYLLLSQANLLASQWILQTILPGVLFAIPVVFQPELRRALERLGRAGVILRPTIDPSTAEQVVTTLGLAAERLAELKHGALIVLERETGLDDLIERGVDMDARLSSDLLLQVFFPNSPLHDGAVVLRGDRLAAARVVIPLVEVPEADGNLGTRHIAAASVSASSDALAVVVSEETGIISLARDGRLARHLDPSALVSLLTGYLVTAPSRTRPLDRLWAAVGELVSSMLQLSDRDAEPVAGAGHGAAADPKDAEPKA
jgi:diadenylate cyclase